MRSLRVCCNSSSCAVSHAEGYSLHILTCNREPQRVISFTLILHPHLLLFRPRVVCFSAASRTTTPVRSSVCVETAAARLRQANRPRPRPAPPFPIALCHKTPSRPPTPCYGGHRRRAVAVFAKTRTPGTASPLPPRRTTAPVSLLFQPCGRAPCTRLARHLGTRTRGASTTQHHSGHGHTCAATQRMAPPYRHRRPPTVAVRA